MNPAARRPAEGDGVISLVNRYIANDVRPEKAGASKTQMLRMSTGSVRKRRTW